MRHLATHPEFQANCYACKLATVTVAGSTPATEMDRREAALSKDLVAYKNLRRNGLQPQHVKGSADLERTATTTWEVEQPKLWRSLDPEGRKHIDEAATAVREIPDQLKAAR